MPVDEAPSDNGPDAPRRTHNFAPGNKELVYRATTRSVNPTGSSDVVPSDDRGRNIGYKLQTTKWGLVPHWVKRSPDNRFTMRTVNCRSESLEESGGLWASVKETNWCVVVAQDFFEWKTNGKKKMPHFVKRKNGQFLRLAGLWDSVTYDSTPSEELFTYIIITTQVNKQFCFIHD